MVLNQRKTAVGKTNNKKGSRISKNFLVLLRQIV